MEEASQAKQDSIKKTKPIPNMQLRRERELRGWSQANVADKIEAQPRLVTRWEMGYALPSPHYRQRLCLLFEKNAEELGLVRRDGTDFLPEEAERVRQGEATPEELEPIKQERDTDSQEISPQETVHEGIQAFPQGTERKPWLSRRTAIATLLGGAVIAGAGGFWFTRNAFSQRPAISTTSTISTAYIYAPTPPVYINFVAWSPRGSWIACCTGDKTVKVLEATTGTPRFVYEGHTDFTECVEWAPDETRLASTSADKTVQIWEPLTGERLLTYRGHTDSVYCVAWSHDGTYIASCGKDTTVQVWNPFNGKLLTTYRGHTRSVWNIKWSADDKSIATCGLDGGIHVWDPATGKANSPFVYQGPASTATELDWSPDGSRIASAHVDKTVHIWDAVTGYPVLTYTGHTATPDTARWSPNGKFIASAGYDNTIQVWNASSGRRLLTYNKHKNEVIEVCWSPSGKQLVTASKDDTLHVCNVVI